MSVRGYEMEGRDNVCMRSPVKVGRRTTLRREVLDHVKLLRNSIQQGNKTFQLGEPLVSCVWKNT